MKRFSAITVVLLLAVILTACSNPPSVGKEVKSAPQGREIISEGEIVAIEKVYYKGTPTWDWQIEFTDGSKESVSPCTFETTPTVGQHYQVYSVRGDKYWQRIADKE